MGQQIPRVPRRQPLGAWNGSHWQDRCPGSRVSSADALTRLATGVADRFLVWMRDGKKKAFGPFPAES